MSTFTPSKYQTAIFDFVQHDTRSAIIEAVAGSGKTTTIVKALELIPKGKDILFIAFNKNIATELQSRVPAGVRAATFHSTALQAFTKSTGTRPKIDGNKVRYILRDNYGDDVLDNYFAFVCKLVGYAKNAGMGYLVPDVPESFWTLINHFDMSLDAENASYDEAIDITRAVLNHSNAHMKHVIDFDDMLYGALIKNATFWPQDFVFVDEAQDTNRVQQALLKRMVKREGGRLIAVGDTAQAIYGFRGADSSAMDSIKTAFDCVPLPLTVSYRCPRAVVRAVQMFVPSIEPHEAAPEGILEALPSYTPDTFGAGDVILCRNTAPVVAFAYALLAKGKACKVLGREIGEGLISLVKKMKAKGIDALVEKLEKYRLRETAKLMSQDKEQQAEAVNDKIVCLMVFINQMDENTRTVPALIARIEALFSDSANGGTLTLATCHKAKGLEWPTVFILDREKYMPSRWARQEWQKVQETNLIYVAYTRAKSRLVFIDSDAWAKPAPTTTTQPQQPAATL